MLQYRECWHFYVLAMAQAQLSQLQAARLYKCVDRVDVRYIYMYI